MYTSFVPDCLGLEYHLILLGGNFINHHEGYPLLEKKVFFL